MRNHFEVIGSAYGWVSERHRSDRLARHAEPCVAASRGRWCALPEQDFGLHAALASFGSKLTHP